MKRGIRYAPSPTGRFHLGNLRTAWISHALSRAMGEPWCVRFEDIDTPRVVGGAREQQLADLESLGLVPDETVLQSERLGRHRELWERARADGVIYACRCSRREVQLAIQGMASAPHGPSPIYNGHCRNTGPTGGPAAWRFRLADPLGMPAGAQDFIVGRSDNAGFVPSYLWACAIDDVDGGYSTVVRAWDLEAVTDQQRAIQTWLGIEPPSVYHCALVVQDDGQRLEKRTRGVTLPELAALGFTPDQVVARFRADWDGSRIGEAAREVSVSQVLGSR